MYSDVVASRSPSPQRETAVVPLEHPVGVVNDLEEVVRERLSDNEKINTFVEEHLSELSVSSSAKQLTTEQHQLVKAAAEALTKQQKQHIHRRHAKVRARRSESVSSREEGTSKPKGKAPDPREWGNSGLTQEELDIETQAAVLDSYNNRNNYTNSSRQRERPKLEPRRPERPPVESASGNRRSVTTKRRTRGAEATVSRPIRPAESQPAAQIAARSYLGTALQNVGRSRNEKTRHSFPSDLQGSSYTSNESSDTDSESGSQTSSDKNRSENSSQRHRYHRQRERRRHHNKHRRRSASPASVIRPIPPKEYHGVADARLYHWFVCESEAYLRDGKVRGRRKVFLLSYFLAGKAYDFYTQKVSMNEEEWTLPQFYTELFNYCFPIDYRMQMRRALARCHQNEKSVAEYVHELQELFNMIGDIPEQDKVIKFWNSARPVIQKGLWRDNLNPEISSWDEVVSQAEVIEISENVAERRDRRHGQPPQPTGSTGNSRPKAQQTDRSIRSTKRKLNYELLANALIAKKRDTSLEIVHIELPLCPPGKNPLEIDSDEYVEVLDSLPVGAMCFGDPSQMAPVIPWPRDEWREHYPWWNEPRILARPWIGDCYAMVADSILTLEQPYPGDEGFDFSDVPPELRFNIVKQTTTDSYVIEDRLTGLHSTIFRSMLENPKFDISHWFAKKQARALNLDSRVKHRHQMGDALSVVATKLLTDGIASSYPCIKPDLDPEDRFYVHLADFGSDEYVVNDIDLEVYPRIPKAWLEDFQFDLVSWYRMFLDQQKIFETQYLKTHLEWCEDEATESPESEEDLELVSVSDIGVENNDLPDLASISDDEDDYSFEYEAEEGLPAGHISESLSNKEDDLYRNNPEGSPDSWSSSTLAKHQMGAVGDVLMERVQRVLNQCQPFPGDELFTDTIDGPRFVIERQNFDMIVVYDRLRFFESHIHLARLRWDTFSVGRWFAERCAVDAGLLEPWRCAHDWLASRRWKDTVMGRTLEQRTEEILHLGAPYENEEDCDESTDSRFEVTCPPLSDQFEVLDRYRGFIVDLPRISLEDPEFNVFEWYDSILAEIDEQSRIAVATDESYWPSVMPIVSQIFVERRDESVNGIEIGGVQVDRNRYPALQRNAAHVKGNQRILPKPIVVKVNVNGHPVRALFDTGSLGDFISTTLADQLNVERENLDAPLALLLAVQGSRSKINSVANIRIQYQGINENCTLDIANLHNYDLILGTPFMYQHKVCVGFNLARHYP
ncbi:hypothetical protein BYT27DRAFT_7217359 [Phlegmacium glaucopus]|nr:hypothetical protein BYT27DRAFT_7217359 [Phlegmacium glaucopus]